MSFLVRAVVAGVVVATASWLAGRYPTRAGFLVALPLSSMLVLPMAYMQHGNIEKIVVLSKSILLAIPASAVFFIPIILAARFGVSFWPSYLLAGILLPLTFLLHQWLAKLLFTGTV